MFKVRKRIDRILQIIAGLSSQVLKFMEETDFNEIAAAGKLGTKARSKAYKRAAEDAEAAGEEKVMKVGKKPKAAQKDEGKDGKDEDSDEDMSFHPHSFTKDAPGEKAIRAYVKVISISLPFRPLK